MLGESSTKVSGYTAAFGYDPAGNLTQFKGQSRTYDQQNRLTGGQGLTGAYVYDERGNPTTYNGVGIAYTPENEATQFGTLLSADYGADGLRAWKQDADGVRTYFLHDGVTPIHELDATGAIKATNTFGPAGLVSRTSRRVVGMSDSVPPVYFYEDAAVFYSFDERGNVSERTDGTGQVLTRHIADAYGNTSTYNARGTVIAQLPDPYSGFGGKYGYYTDVETGLVLCTYRYYDPNTGRWLNRDPIGYLGGINTYAYVTGNPINATDPLGLAEILLGFREVWQNAPLIGPFNTGGWHAFLIIRDEKTNQMWSVSAGPQSDKSTEGLKSGEFGKITLFASKFPEGSYDLDNKHVTKYVTILKDSNSAQNWYNKLKTTGQRLISYDLDYRPFQLLGGQNSNGFARELMQRTGLGGFNKAKRDRLGVWAPHWDDDPWQTSSEDSHCP